MSNINHQKSCAEIAISDDYLDILIDYTYEDIDTLLIKYGAECYQIIDEEYVILYIRVTSYLACRTLFKTFLPVQITLPVGQYGKDALDESGILYFHNQPFIPLKGKDVIIGIIDSGIDFTHSVFLNKNGSSKIISIWDQTGLGNPPEGFIFGTEFTNDNINEALKSDKPYDIVSEIDETGHGTFLAGVAAGEKSDENDFIGAAPESELIVVKLKQQKKCARLAYGLDEEDIVYQDADIMLGINYIQQKANSLNRPLVIIIGLGSNAGPHDGSLLLETFMDKQSEEFGTVFTVAAGNEANLGHHFRGQYSEEEEYQDIEFNIAEGESSVTCTLFSIEPDFYSIGIISPTGEYISRIPVRRRRFDTFKLVLDITEIYIYSNITETFIGKAVVDIHLVNPVEGIWILRIFGDVVINGRYDIYLTRKDWIKPDTRFLQPDPFTTVTFPSTSNKAITVGAYNHVQGNLDPSSGRGLTTDNKQKPDLVAPGVNIFGPLPNNQYGFMSGTSIAAAITAGACALLLEWGIILGNVPKITPTLVKVWLIRGTNRKSYLNYPNPLWGFGQLDFQQSFEILKNIYLD